MKRRPQPGESKTFNETRNFDNAVGELGLVLSGGGARAAYQVGALRALLPYLSGSSLNIDTIVGSSIGAVNGIVLGAALKGGLDAAISELESMWAERTFRNTFVGSPSLAFVRAIRVAISQYLAPGPHGNDLSVFNPKPLMDRIDSVIEKYGGLHPDNRMSSLRNLAVMTTIEGRERKPLLFLSSHKRVDPEFLLGSSFEICYVESLSARHGFASAALPSILPPVELDTEAGKVRLVDGGISQNVPVDPAVRLGASRIILIDISGRDWWFDQFGEPHDTRPDWEVPAGADTFCLRPPEIFVIRCMKPLGPVLKESVGSNTSKFIASLGPVWPLFALLKKKLGEMVAYEVMSYVALDQGYLEGIMERGFNETNFLLKKWNQIQFEQAGVHAS